jgi:Tripartite tricarboxylate transporter TctB family
MATVKIRAPKEFWSGLMYIGLAVAFLWFGRNYRLGTASRMGPGYFPFFLALGLGLIGLVAIARSCILKGEPVEQFAWRPLALILGSCVAFGILINGAGLIIALLVMCLMSAAASAYFKIGLQPLAALALLIFCCTIVFIKGLGVSMPILGVWFGDALPAWLIR